MALSRKHYKKIASILSQLNTNIETSQDKSKLFVNSDVFFHEAVDEIVSFLKSDNPNFNSAKFREAVYER